MRRWLRPWIARVANPSRLRYLSTVNSGLADAERISVKCGSAGSMSVDLHNVAKGSSSDPLLIYFPPYSANSAQSVSPIPEFCRRYPTAVINYRWAGYDPFEVVEPPSNPGECANEDALASPLTWPTPVHDSLHAYDWIVKNLNPPVYTRRDVYVYGSYLGATLATSLALTECHPHQRMAVRGIAAYNGIYNWTMFLPDHQINKQSGFRAANILEEILGHPTDPTFQDLKQHASTLFGNPAHLFDPFASPCLFFQTPGLLAPQDFESSADPVVTLLTSSSLPSDDAKESVDALVAMMADKAPRRSPLAFPPRQSTLKLPETLLLHSHPPSLSVSLRKKPLRRRKTMVSNHFRTQAEELASLMRRSLEKLELKERAKWDDSCNEYEEIERRVQVHDVLMEDNHFELPDRGEALVCEWLEDRMSSRF